MSNSSLKGTALITGASELAGYPADPVFTNQTAIEFSSVNYRFPCIRKAFIESRLFHWRGCIGGYRKRGQ
jgi:hypothetical protein